MTAWSIFCGAVKAFVVLLFLVAVADLVASVSYGFRAYMPVNSFVFASIVVFVIIFVIYWATGGEEE
jgi:cellulose synthase/poly-beta-1,6-N-acetylglucosamine synthase-like glycosyltransferase